MNDDDLIRRAESGDAGAKDELCRRLTLALRPYVRRRMGENARAALESSDVVQQVMLEFLDRLPQLCAGATYREVLEGLQFRAYGRILNTRRVALRPLQNLVEHLVSRAEPKLDSQGPVTWDDTLRALEELVRRLPDPYSGAVRARALEGLDWEQAAGRLDAKPETLRKRYRRAVLMLADRIAAREPAPGGAGERR